MEQMFAPPTERFIQRQRPKPCTNGIRKGREIVTMPINNQGMIRTNHGVVTTTRKTIQSQSKANLRIRCVDSERTVAVTAAATAPEVRVDGDGNNSDAISSLPTSLCSGDDTNGSEGEQRRRGPAVPR
ncbi:hypothetical protein LWI28_019717 [Acer negundo]|uniref:Uncharacterized protein n=1 Tax=Acer negundo TaxID=4023 RepID=A0AAD5J0F4_ACENE|nr:hypothetical protein LWI28_019717 [Acer negundo]